MFKVDKMIFDYFYNICLKTGRSFGFGAVEGFILYFSIIVAGVMSCVEKRAKK